MGCLVALSRELSAFVCVIAIIITISATIITLDWYAKAICAPVWAAPRHQLPRQLVVSSGCSCSGAPEQCLEACSLSLQRNQH